MTDISITVTKVLYTKPGGETLVQTVGMAVITPEIQSLILAPLVARLEALERGAAHGLSPLQVAARQAPVDAGPVVCPIPRDLKPGDKLWLNDGTSRIVDSETTQGSGPYYRDGDIACEGGGRNVFRPNGYEYQGHDLFVVRIERDTPPADDATVEALDRVLESQSDAACNTKRSRAILTAIRRGEVNGLYDESVKQHWMEYHQEKIDQIAALRADVERWREENDDLRQTLKTRANRADTLVALEGAHERLRKAHADRIDEIGKKEARIATLTAEVERLTRERDYDKHKARVAELEAKLESANQAAIRQEDAKNRLAAELALSKESERQFRAEVEAGFRKHGFAAGPQCIDNLVRELAEARAENGRLEDLQRGSSRTDFDQAQCEITALKIAVHNCKLAQDRAEAELAALKGRKVKLPFAFNINTQGTVREVGLMRASEVCDAIRAAGVEVAE